jgi:hypothetical protein
MVVGRERRRRLAGRPPERSAAGATSGSGGFDVSAGPGAAPADRLTG